MHKTEICGVIIICVALTVLLAACSTNYEEALLGKWYDSYDMYVENSPYHSFEFFSDGTCDMFGYVDGTWAIVNENQLKVTDAFGQVTDLWTIESIEDGHITFEEGYELWGGR